MRVRVAGIEQDSIVDGEGLRTVIFLQGCMHECKGCHNPETWDMRGGKVMDIEEIYQIIDENPLIDGITISGGEPFLQPMALIHIARYARLRGKTVWVYTGYRWEEVWEYWNICLDYIDVLVDGRYEEENRSMSLEWRGSSNQRVIDVKESTKNNAKIL